MGLKATRELSEAVFPALARKVLILELLRIILMVGPASANSSFDSCHNFTKLKGT